MFGCMLGRMNSVRYRGPTYTFGRLCDVVKGFKGGVKKRGWKVVQQVSLVYCPEPIYSTTAGRRNRSPSGKGVEKPGERGINLGRGDESDVHG